VCFRRDGIGSRAEGFCVLSDTLLRSAFGELPIPFPFSFLLSSVPPKIKKLTPYKSSTTKATKTFTWLKPPTAAPTSSPSAKTSTPFPPPRATAQPQPYRRPDRSRFREASCSACAETHCRYEKGEGGSRENYQDDE
jgi:hypothetical protein